MLLLSFHLGVRCRTKEEVQNDRDELHPASRHVGAARRPRAAVLGANGLSADTRRHTPTRADTGIRTMRHKLREAPLARPV